MNASGIFFRIWKKIHVRKIMRTSYPITTFPRIILFTHLLLNILFKIVPLEKNDKIFQVSRAFHHKWKNLLLSKTLPALSTSLMINKIPLNSVTTTFSPLGRLLCTHNKKKIQKPGQVTSRVPQLIACHNYSLC